MAREQIETHLQQSYLLVFKGIIPLITLVFLSIIFWGNRGIQIVLLVPPLVLAMIYLTAAKIKASNNTLTYLIFATWRQIPYAEVTSVGWSIFPGLGYVKLRTFLPPWGKLYFVVEERTCLKREPTSAMREILKHTRESRPASHDSASERSSVQSEKGARTTWIGVSVCGMLCGGVIGWRNQPQLLSRAAFSANSQHLRILVKFLAYINHPVWYLGLSVILLLFLSYRRFQGIESLVAAFVMGGMAASLLRLWILG